MCGTLLRHVLHTPDATIRAMEHLPLRCSRARASGSRSRPVDTHPGRIAESRESEGENLTARSGSFTVSKTRGSSHGGQWQS